ncbi:PBP1A family penicillin-binding protein [Lysinibacillus sp. 54212]|uniref:PBP1A family penicillin-binding protein n=1 Tax=Lysinibacillus sp. 54212 TaxID=3119829 RepID=UPI002FCAC88C
MTQQKRTREDVKRARELQNKKSKTPLKLWLKRIVLTLVIVGVVGFLGGAGLFAYYASNAPELDEELLKDPISSEFYDVNGELFATVGIDEKRKYIEFDEIPDSMVDAILATEDVRFFEHSGVDLWRLGGAVIANFRQGFGSQGASTITQQVIKNSFFTNEKKLERKAQEAWLALKLERKYDKEEIFEMYFNKVLMSGTTYGFGTAAEYFYGKKLSELELQEMALLAGMPQSPNNYNPFKNPERAEKRRNIVLGLMVQHGKITEAQAEKAKAIPVEEGLLPENERVANATTKFPAFLDVVLSELEENDDYESLADGIKVYTTLDPQAQTIVESVMNNDENFPKEKIQSGVSVIDTKTGAIRAIGGSRNYADRDYNYAYDLKQRSPGSTIKPLVDYGPAIEYLKWSTGETIVDEPMKYSGTNQTITNFDNKYLGTMTIRKALYQSRNIPAVKALKAVTPEKAQKFIGNLGIKTDYLVESDAIGGGRVNISPIQLAASYAALGNKGVYTDPHSITKIVYRDGVTSKKYKPESNVAMADSTAYMVTDILRDVVSTKPGAPAKNAIVPGIDIAGKTGTTNYSSDEFKKYNFRGMAVPDSWFVGYSPNYSIAVWSGYSERKDALTTWEERWLPQRLFKSIMSQLSENVPNTKFTQPNSVVSATIELGTSPLKLASEYTPNELKATELFVRGTVPTEVSDKYEKITLDPPFGLKADYNEDASLINLSWDHTLPTTGDDDERQDSSITYEVSMKVDNGKSTVIETTGAKNVTIPNVQPGSNYTFSVVAIMDDTRSEPASVSIFIEGIVIPEEPTEPDIDDDDGDNENGNGNNNGNGNGNGNGNNNGNNNGNGNGNGSNNGNGNGNQVVTPPTEPTEPETDD